jgi:TonB family protein
MIAFLTDGHGRSPVVSTPIVAGDTRDWRGQLRANDAAAEEMRRRLAASSPTVADRPKTDTASVDDAPAAPEARAGSIVITQPDWVRRPDAEDLERYYPERAQRMNVEGRASISCTVDASGTLQNCSVSNENPSDQGFGDAALQMSKLFKLRPKTLDGVPVDGGKITIPINFSLPKG